MKTIGLSSLHFLLDLGPGIAQLHCPIEHGMAGLGVHRIRTEISHAQELERASRSSLSQARLRQAILEHLKRLRIEICQKILARQNIIRILFGKQVIVEPHLGFYCMLRRNPMQRAFNLPAV